MPPSNSVNLSIACQPMVVIFKAVANCLWWFVKCFNLTLKLDELEIPYLITRLMVSCRGEDIAFELVSFCCFTCGNVLPNY